MAKVCFPCGGCNLHTPFSLTIENSSLFFVSVAPSPSRFYRYGSRLVRDEGMNPSSVITIFLAVITGAMAGGQVFNFLTASPLFTAQ